MKTCIKNHGFISLYAFIHIKWNIKNFAKWWHGSDLDTCHLFYFFGCGHPKIFDAIELLKCRKIDLSICGDGYHNGLTISIKHECLCSPVERGATNFRRFLRRFYRYMFVGLK